MAGGAQAGGFDAGSCHSCRCSREEAQRPTRARQVLCALTARGWGCKGKGFDGGSCCIDVLLGQVLGVASRAVCMFCCRANMAGMAEGNEQARREQENHAGSEEQA
eukprot:scaffold69309_cov15-Tisochrysis_lutea.AAC.1